MNQKLHIPIIHNSLPTLILLWFLTFAGSLNAQPGIELLRTYSADRFSVDNIYDLYHKSIGGYFLCGSSNGQGWLLSVRENGELLWSTVVDAEAFYSVIETDSGHLLTGGRTADNQFTAWLIDGEDGQVIWSETYGRGTCQSVIELKSGQFALAGSIRGGDNGSDAFLNLISEEDGQTIWEAREEIQNQFNRRFFGMRETEGGIVTVGDDFPHGISSKYDFEGNLQWSRTYESQAYTVSMSGIVSCPTGFAFGGYGYNLQGRDDRYGRLTLVDRAGQLESLTTYPSGRNIHDYLWGIGRMSDNGFIMIGETYDVRDDPYLRTFLMIRTQQNGDLVWRTRFDGLQFERSGSDRLNSVIVQDNDRIAVCGSYNNPDGDGNLDGILIRLFPDQPGPFLFYKSPEDSVLTVLSGDSIQFIVRARNRDDIEITYQWEYDDEIIDEDTAVTISFFDIGQFPVRCLVQDRDGEFVVTWRVTVTDLYVSAFTPDTLDLAVRRGYSVDFSLDTIRYTPGAEPEILWTKTNLANGQSEAAGTEPRAPIEFPWSGEYSVEGRVSRGESSDAVTWHVLVKGAIWAYVPMADSLEVPPDSVVHFEVVPSAPEDESLEVAWLVDGELVREGEVSLEWVFRRVENPPYWSRVLCIVADSVEADTVQWMVTVNDLSIGDTKEVGRVRSPVLLSVSPNPFNSMLTIRYVTGGWETAATRLGYAMGSQAAPTRLGIYDIAGREVAHLPGSTGVTAGRGFHPATEGGATEHQIVWDASVAPAGVYFVRLQVGGVVSAQKVVLMR